MSIYALKPKFQNLLRPLVRQLAAKGVTANQVTLIACLLSILLGVVLALFPTFSSLFFLILLLRILRVRYASFGQRLPKRPLATAPVAKSVKTTKCASKRKIPVTYIIQIDQDDIRVISRHPRNGKGRGDRQKKKFVIHDIII